MNLNHRELGSLVEDIAIEEASARGWIILPSALSELREQMSAVGNFEQFWGDEVKLRTELAQLLEGARRYGEPIGKEQIYNAMKYAFPNCGSLVELCRKQHYSGRNIGA
jgi:hypothetical protein